MADSTNCRTCFNLLDSRKSSNLNDKPKNYEIDFGQILFECTGVYLERGFICSNCHDILIKCYEFKQKVFETDQIFQKLENQVEFIKQEEIKVEVDAWEPDYKNDASNDDEEVENSNLSEKVEKEQGTSVVSKKSKKERKRPKHTKFLRRYLDPQRQINLEKYKKNDGGFFECPYEKCSGLFKLIGRLEIHLETKHSESGDQKEFKCKKCGEEFTTIFLYNKHNLRCQKPKPYICDLCGKNYINLTSLRIHIDWTHLNIRPKMRKCACPTCGKIYASQSHMLKHQKRIHFAKENIEKPCVCSVCGSRWASEGVLRHHMKNHNACDLACDLCSKKYNTKNALQQHMHYRHIQNKPFCCDICAKTFKLNKQLVSHQLTHSEERPFRCSKCPASFKLPNTLKKHDKLVHSSVPVTCEICGETKKNDYSLKGHMLRHIGKDHFCPHCDKSYKIAKSLRGHIQSVHKGEKLRHECTICFQNWYSRKAVIKHVEETHQNVLLTNGKNATDLVRKYCTTDRS